MDWGRIKRLVRDAGDWGGRLQSYAWLGGFTVSAGLFTWLGQQWDALAAHGWAAVVLFGIAAALTTVLVLSIALIAWRLFRPLPPQEQPRSSLVVPADPEAERDLNLLHWFSVLQATVAMLKGLLEIAPQQGDLTAREAPEDLHGLCEVREEFVRKAASTIGAGTHRYSSYMSIVNQAGHEAEHFIKQIPPAQRPTTIDPLDLRRYEIARFQCLRAVAFLNGEAKKMEDEVRSQRSQLVERYYRRNPQ